MEWIGWVGIAGDVTADASWPPPSALDWASNWPYALAYLSVLAVAVALPKKRFWYAVPLACCWPIVFWSITA